MSETKMTKAEKLAAIEAILVGAGETELAEFAAAEQAALAAKAVKAKERAASKAAEVDEYEAIVAGALTDEFQTGADITALVGDEDLTLGKVRARLTKLVKSGAAVKEEVKVADGDKTRSVMGYKLA